MAAAASAAASKQPQNPQGDPHGAAMAAAAAAAAANAAAAGAGANPGSLLFGLNGWQPPASASPSFPPLGFPGFQHPLFKPGKRTFFNICVNHSNHSTTQKNLQK